MLNSMRQRGFSARIQDRYARTVEGLVRYCRRALTQMQRNDIEAYFDKELREVLWLEGTELVHGIYCASCPGLHANPPL